MVSCYLTKAGMGKFKLFLAITTPNNGLAIPPNLFMWGHETEKEHGNPNFPNITALQNRWPYPHDHARSALVQGIINTKGW